MLLPQGFQALNGGKRCRSGDGRFDDEEEEETTKDGSSK